MAKDDMKAVYDSEGPYILTQTQKDYLTQNLLPGFAEQGRGAIESVLVIKLAGAPTGTPTLGRIIPSGTMYRVEMWNFDSINLREGHERLIAACRAAKSRIDDEDI